MYDVIDRLEKLPCPEKARRDGTHGFMWGECYGCKKTIQQIEEEMTKPTITADQLVEALETVVSRAPKGYVYANPTGSCLYQYKGKPSCLIGQAIVELGHEINPEWDEFSGGLNATRVLEDYFDVSPETAYIGQQAQTVQDNFQPWAEALRVAKRTKQNIEEGAISLGN